MRQSVVRLLLGNRVVGVAVVKIGPYIDTFRQYARVYRYFAR